MGLGPCTVSIFPCPAPATLAGRAFLLPDRGPNPNLSVVTPNMAFRAYSMLFLLPCFGACLVAGLNIHSVYSSALSWADNGCLMPRHHCVLQLAI